MASEDELAAEKGAAETGATPAFARKRPARKPFPDHLPRERHRDCRAGELPVLRLGAAALSSAKTSPRLWR